MNLNPVPPFLRRRTEPAVPEGLVGARVVMVMVMDMCRNRTPGAEEGGRDIGQGMGEPTLELAKERGIVTLFSCSRGEWSYEIPALEQGVLSSVGLPFGFSCQLQSRPP